MLVHKDDRNIRKEGVSFSKSNHCDLTRRTNANVNSNESVTSIASFFLEHAVCDLSPSTESLTGTLNVNRIPSRWSQSRRKNLNLNPNQSLNRTTTLMNFVNPFCHSPNQILGIVYNCQETRTS